MTEQVLDRDHETNAARTSSALGRTTMSMPSHSLETKLNLRPFRRQRRDKFGSALAPTAIAATVAVIMLNEAPDIALALMLGIAAVLAVVVVRASALSRGSIVLVGKSPMASVIASTIEARADVRHPVSVLR